MPKGKTKRTNWKPNANVVESVANQVKNEAKRRKFAEAQQLMMATSSPMTRAISVPQIVPENDIRAEPGCKSVVTVLWEGLGARNVLLIKKHKDLEITSCVKDIADWLQLERNVRVFVEASVKAELPDYEIFCPQETLIHMCVCLGGDGTLLHLNSLFQHVDSGVPPTISISMGTLGFLTPFEFKDFRRAIAAAMGPEPCCVTLRMRLTCSIFHGDSEKPAHSYQVLNEVLIDRGGSPYILSLTLAVDKEDITTIQADGLVISTPTGSTAYSLSAGGSMVAPSVSAILLTPICPHSLSFRPVILSDNSLVEIRIPKNSNPAVVSCDGRQPVKIREGDRVQVSMSPWPFPTFVNTFHMDEASRMTPAAVSNAEWFRSMESKLSWNQRENPTREHTINRVMSLSELPETVCRSSRPSPGPGEAKLIVKTSNNNFKGRGKPKLNPSLPATAPASLSLSPSVTANSSSNSTRPRTRNTAK